MVDVIVFAPLAFYECLDSEMIWGEFGEAYFAHRQRAVSHLSRDKANEYLALAAWVTKLQKQYGNKVHVHITDAISIEGAAKSTQYGVNAYPAMVIGHHYVYNAYQLDEASQQVAAILNNVTELSQ